VLPRGLKKAHARLDYYSVLNFRRELKGMFRWFRGHKTIIEPMVAAAPVIFSYRFNAHLQPNWAAIVKRIFHLSTEKERSEFGDKLSKTPHEMLGRSYDFTEFFDSFSGLTMRRIGRRRDPPGSTSARMHK
jgi:hypothetical protein